jgi:hypothetical protein
MNDCTDDQQDHARDDTKPQDDPAPQAAADLDDLQFE